jgi:hypothetical protein
MAQPTSTHSTYDHVGNREDLSDVIHNVDPTATPYLTMLPKIKATSTKHEWLTRSLAAASATNFVIEGNDAVADAANANVRVFNYRAISDKVAIVSGSQEDGVNPAGIKSTMALEMADKMKELKRDVEKALLENNAYVAGNDTLASECAGLQAYILTNTSKASDAVAATGDGSDAHTDGTARVLTETMVETVLASAWSNGGNPTKGFLGSFQKRKFATFSGSSTKMSDGDKRKVVNSVDFYVDPLGNEVSLVPCRHVPADVIYFVDPEYVKFATLRNFRSWDLAKSGDSYKKQILVEYTQEVCTQKAHAAVYDLTTS